MAAVAVIALPVSVLAAEPVAFGYDADPDPAALSLAPRVAEPDERKAAFFAAVPMKRGATPQEVADAILFVSSEKASFITGQIIRVNGGKTAS